jgi:ubiquinol-cytochrome c reductase cytochrome b subunit
LIDVILPIFDKYPILSNKQYDYLRFREALLKEIKYYKDLDNDYIRPTTPLNSLESIISVPYFSV